MLKRQAVGMKDSSALKVNRRVIRAGRPTTALITRQSAAEAALAMIDQNGLEALSLLSVARVLGVSAPSVNAGIKWDHPPDYQRASWFK